MKSSPVKRAAAKSRRAETQAKKLVAKQTADAAGAIADAAVRVTDGLTGVSASTTDAVTRDSFFNSLLQLGGGTDNALSASSYGFNPITRIRTLLEWIHRGSWLGGVAVDLVADDMVKMGITFTGELDPDDIETLQKGLIDYGVWESISDTVKWSRLYGGALAPMLIDGQALDSPLRIKTIGKGQFKGMLSLDRWMVEPDLVRLVQDYGPYIGTPEYYRVTSDAPALNLKVIHYSRCLRLEGIRLPYWQRVMENLWGISVIERLYDRMVAFDAATQGAAQLVHKMHLRIYKVKGLREMASSNSIALQGLLSYLQLMRRQQSNEGITLMDAEDDYVPNQQTVNAGISDTLERLGEQLCGALQIPAVRLFGMSPGGLNSTGESDLRMYYDGIRQQQKRHLTVPLTQVIRVLAASLGIKLPPHWGFEFVPLWQMTEDQKAEIAAKDVETISKADERNLISQKTAMKELKQSSLFTGRFTNITDDDIESADESTKPPQAEEMLAGMQGVGGEEHGQLGSVPKALGTPMSPQSPRQSGKMRDHLNAADPIERGLAEDLNRYWKQTRVVRDAHMPISEYMGIPVVIDSPEGTARWPGGPAWPSDYGYIRGTESAEGKDEPADVFIGPHRDSKKAFVINHYTASGDFEEHKYFLGFTDIRQVAKIMEKAYVRPVREFREIPVDSLMSFLQHISPIDPLSSSNPPSEPPAAVH
jgi:uncharacterized protein